MVPLYKRDFIFKFVSISIKKQMLFVKLSYAIDEKTAT